MSSLSSTSFSRLCRPGRIVTSSAQTTPVADARAERHADDVAGRKLHPRRHPVGIGLVERDRHQDIDECVAAMAKVWPIPRG